MFRPGMHPVTFVATDSGQYTIERITAVRGDELSLAARVAVHHELRSHQHGAWALRGVTGHARYVERAEKTELDAASPALGRPAATCAAAAFDELLVMLRSREEWAFVEREVEVRLVRSRL